MHFHSDCCGCSLCENLCPVDAITVEENERGFLTRKIDEQKCVNCSLCQVTCEAKIECEEDFTRKAFAGKSTDYNIRFKSSSGGVFGTISSEIIKKNGVVYGAAYANDNTVVHLRVDDLKDLARLQGSKYVQSDMSGVFTLVKEDLVAGRIVLFSGTPCQVEGLYKFLKRKYDHLYTIDIICHGVTSRGVWKSYLNYLSNDKKDNITEINFRDKQTGWHRFSFSYKRNGKKISCLFIDNPFCFFFDKHYIINQACFNCKYASNKHLADITLGDLWGVQHFEHIQDDNIGTSLVIVSSKKGESLITLTDGLELVSIDEERAMSYNLHEPPKKPDDYEEFWAEYEGGGIKKSIKRFFYGSFMRRCKLFIKSFLTRTHLIKFFIK